MKRRIAFFVCLVLVISVVAGLFSYSRAADVDYKYVRVKISIGTPTSFSFFVDGNYSVSGQALERQLYTVRIDGSQLKLCLGDTTVAQGSTIYITRHQGTPGRNNIIWLNNSQYGYRQYLGDMSFSIQNGAIQLVNRIPMEEYLYGVVPHEMSNSFPPEALKSQAVAARNYTVRKISSSGTYDVTDLASKDQVYKGYDASENFAIAAVNATAGQVLKSGSTIIQAYYSASNGGMTELPYHRWGGGGDWRYYDIQPDPYDLENPESLYETISFPVTIDANHPVTSKGNDGTPNTTVAVNYIKTAILNSGKLAAYGVTNISQFELSGVTSLEAHTHESPASTNGRSSQDHSRMPITGVNNCIDMVYATGSFTVTILPAGSGTVVSVTNVDFNMRSLNGSDGSSTWKAFQSTSLGVLVVDKVTDQYGTLLGFNLS
ncbi:MAG: SpoIID/LytB domain-containing protein, partial [Christensenellales bacterium]